MTFSLFKYFDAILDGVEQNGLAALEQPEVKEALAELDSFLPPLSNVAKLVFSYHYVYQLKPQPLFIFQLEKDLNVPTLYLEHEAARQALANKTGARGLKSILSNLLSAALFECQLHKKKEYLLTLKE